MKEFTEQELKEYATEQSQTIIIRSYEDGNSTDTRRKSTKPERKIIESIIFGGLLAIKDNNIINKINPNKDSQGIIDACEYIGKLQIPEMNGYDTIYIPLKDWSKNNL